MSFPIEGIQSALFVRTTSRISRSILIGLFLVPGCASHESHPSVARPGAGISEYRQIATVAQKEVQAMLNSLATVGAQSNSCPPNVLSAFSREVERLQVESVQIRARGQAIRARGDAYFERWHQNMVQVEDPKLRDLAESRRPLLQQSFLEIKRLSQEGREAFELFLSELRQLRTQLERDPSSIGATPAKELVKSATQNGTQVETSLEGIISELDSMQAMLTLPPAIAKVDNL